LEPATSSNVVVMICPNLKCRRVLQVPAKYRGQHVKCRYCGLTFAVPLARVQLPSGDKSEEQATDTKEQEAKKEGDAKNK
jgi:hypothetical protein